MTLIDLERLARITPRALEQNRRACVCANAALIGYGILQTPDRAAHFWAQVLHETAGLSVLVENLFYTAQRLTEVWPSRFRTLASAEPYARNPRALANNVYGGRNGNVDPEDGWTFIGRGLLQLTGRANYARIGSALGLDLVGQPTLVIDPEYSLSVAAEIWKQADGNTFADRDDIIGVTRAINGGLIGLDDRKRWLGRARSILTQQGHV